MGSPEWWIKKWGHTLGNQSYWRMSGVIATSVTTVKFYEVTGLIEIEATYKRMHAERMMIDRCHGKQLEFIFD